LTIKLNFGRLFVRQVKHGLAVGVVLFSIAHLADYVAYGFHSVVLNPHTSGFRFIRAAIPLSIIPYILFVALRGVEETPKKVFLSCLLVCCTIFLVGSSFSILAYLHTVPPEHRHPSYYVEKEGTGLTFVTYTGVYTPIELFIVGQTLAIMTAVLCMALFVIITAIRSALRRDHSRIE
jgi:hypothetical protein